ncbi:MAG TPA: hypothetical protein VGO93_12280 [Candidatus Xenobia bacterium]|jgi:hypothetical protein
MRRRDFLALALMAPLVGGPVWADDLPSGLSPTTFKALDKMVDNLLGAYNAKDGKKYVADFDPSYQNKTPAETERWGQTYVVETRQQFGAYRSRVLDSGMCSIYKIDEGGTSSLVYRLQMDKGPAFLYVTIQRNPSGFKFGAVTFHDKALDGME